MMPEGAVIDTDIILKISAYRLGDELLDLFSALGDVGVLGLVHIIALSQLKKGKSRLNDIQGASTELHRLLTLLARVEPTDEEIDLAAVMEDEALRSFLPLDRGEAQLLAILLNRRLPLMVTGDKRAISIIEQILANSGFSNACAGRIVCLEQVIKAIISRVDITIVRTKVCAEPKIDTAVCLCFACSTPLMDIATIRNGLDSYIGHLRKTDQGVLVADDLSSLA